MMDAEIVGQETTPGTIKLYGSLDVHHLDQLYECLKAHCTDRALVLDFSEVFNMDTASVQLLLAFKRSFSKDNQLTLSNMSPALELTWETIGVKQILLKQ